MHALGINLGLLEIFITILLIGLPVISLIDLARKRLSGTPLAVWVLVICAVPVLGSLAYWIVKPAPELQ
jgi:Phospholipase_D-nuclease N-terminal